MTASAALDSCLCREHLSAENGSEEEDGEEDICKTIS